jgi:hypothetical protein
MRSWLSKRNIQLTRSLGQNFLHDGNQLRRIVEAAQLKPADKVLEIGPGLGPLTELLAAQAGEVLAIEMDARLVEVLCERFHLATRPGEFPAPEPVASAPGEEPPAAAGAPDNLFLVHDDALAYLRREPRDWSDWKLVANLPYSVASPILVELAAGARAPEMFVAPLQLVVDTPAGARMSFWHRESTEGNYDFLNFIVDGVVIARWAGENDWAQQQTPLSAGTHEIKFRYEKDVNALAGDDTVWIDDVLIQP